MSTNLFRIAMEAFLQTAEYKIHLKNEAFCFYHLATAFVQNETAFEKPIKHLVNEF
jgi:hypothetical protein